MPQVTDLMAEGMAWPLAAGLGNTAAFVTGTGATQAAAKAIQPGNHLVLLVNTTASSAGVVFATNFELGTPVYVALTATAGVSGTVFCPVSGSMNGTANGSVTLSTGKSAIFIQSTAGVWYSIPLAPG